MVSILLCLIQAGLKVKVLILEDFCVTSQSLISLESATSASLNQAIG